MSLTSLRPSSQAQHALTKSIITTTTISSSPTSPHNTSHRSFFSTYSAVNPILNIRRQQHYQHQRHHRHDYRRGQLQHRHHPQIIQSTYTQLRGFTRNAMTSSDAATGTANATVSSGETRRPRRFAPLNDDKVNEDWTRGLSRLRGIVFDVDGTLCLPQNYMFGEMRAALEIPKGVDILDHVRSLSNEPDSQDSSSPRSPPHASTDTSQQPSEQNLSHTASTDPPTDDAPQHSSPQSRATDAIRAIERNAMTSQRPQPGLVELMTYLTERNIPKGICTRNFPAPVSHLLDNFLPAVTFHPIITRDTEGLMPKPSPEGIWRCAEGWGLDQALEKRDVERVVEDMIKGGRVESERDLLGVAKRYLGSGLIMVGDSIDDMAAGYRAGAATVLLVNEENKQLADHKYTDLSVTRLDELIEVLENGFVGREDD